MTFALADFAKLVELFDAHQLSFVSVVIRFWLVNDYRLSVEVRISEKTGGTLEVHDSEVELVMSSRKRVPRPMICLNSVIELMFWSRTISLQVLASTPVVKSLDVVTITGYGSSLSIKYESCAFPSLSSLVIRITYRRLLAAAGIIFTSSCRIRSAWSWSSQKTMVLAIGSADKRYSQTFLATSLVRFSNTKFRSKS
jgi:hypothetical protein